MTLSSMQYATSSYVRLICCVHMSIYKERELNIYDNKLNIIDDLHMMNTIFIWLWGPDRVLNVGLCQLKIWVKLWKDRCSKLKDATRRLLIKEWEVIHHLLLMLHWSTCFHCSLLELQYSPVLLNLGEC